MNCIATMVTRRCRQMYLRPLHDLRGVLRVPLDDRRRGASCRLCRTWSRPCRVPMKAELVEPMLKGRLRQQQMLVEGQCLRVSRERRQASLTPKRILCPGCCA